MIGGEREIIFGLDRHMELNEEANDPNIPPHDLVYDGKDPRRFATPNDAISRYHLGLIVTTLRWVVYQFKAWKTKYPPLCLSDSKIDPLAKNLIRKLHVLLRIKEFSSESEERGRTATRSATPEESLGSRRARKTQSAPERAEGFVENDEMLQLVRERPMIPLAVSLEPSPAGSWNCRCRDCLEKEEGWHHHVDEEIPDPMEVWKPSAEADEQQHEQQTNPINTEVTEVQPSSSSSITGNISEDNQEQVEPSAPANKGDYVVDYFNVWELARRRRSGS